jgi:hypothetical protein
MNNKILFLSLAGTTLATISLSIVPTHAQSIVGGTGTLNGIGASVGGIYGTPVYSFTRTQVGANSLIGSGGTPTTVPISGSTSVSVGVQALPGSISSNGNPSATLNNTAYGFTGSRILGGSIVLPGGVAAGVSGGAGFGGGR